MKRIVRYSRLIVKINVIVIKSVFFEMISLTTFVCYTIIIWFVWKNVKLISIQILILCANFCAPFKPCAPVRQLWCTYWGTSECWFDDKEKKRMYEKAGQWECCLEWLPFRLLRALDELFGLRDLDFWILRSFLMKYTCFCHDFLFCLSSTNYTFFIRNLSPEFVWKVS